MQKQALIRNFAIIAHVDHGKSTLSDRFLEITRTVTKEKMQEQFLDQNIISRKRGITIKLAPVRMNYKYKDQVYELNLIDTPGHVDFSYEVSRTLAACEGAILLVDATQGIQAQTVAHYNAAKKEKLKIIPALNKIDLPNAQTDTVIEELEEYFGFKKDEILFVSAKTGEAVPELLDQVIERIPPPAGMDTPLRALIFDAAYDEYRGVIAYIRIIDGSMATGQKIQLFQNNIKTEVGEVGYFNPFLIPCDVLATGEIGYLITGIKDIRQARVGDTIISQNDTAKPLPGYTTPKPMVFFGMYPTSTDEFIHLRDALGKLTLNDTSLTYTDEYSAYLGSGFRVGFLGLLHAEIIRERLKQEFNLDLLLTQPQVLYVKHPDGTIDEPYMLISIFTPTEYVGAIITVCQKKKGNLIDMTYHDAYTVLSYEMPYSMFIRGLVSELKSVSAGFASVDYELTGYKPANVVSLQIKINDTPIDVLSELVYKDESSYIAREKAEKLKNSLPRQQFRQIIQAVVDTAIIAREEIPPFRKDVLAKMSGGDRTRKDKLLEAQKKGKKRMIKSGKVVLSQDALYSLISNED